MAKRKSHDNNKARLTARERAVAAVNTWLPGGASLYPRLTQAISRALMAHARATLGRAKRRAR